MNTEEKLKIMNATIKPVMNLLQNRLNNRIDALNAFATTTLDNIPAEIQKMREDEASKIRAVMQEQRDLIDILKVMYPDA